MTNEINQVVIDGGLTNVSLNDEESGVDSTPSDEGDVTTPSKDGTKKTGFWSRTLGRKRNAPDKNNSSSNSNNHESMAKDDTDESDANNATFDSSQESQSGRSDGSNAKGGDWLSSLLNVCTFGLLAPSASSSGSQTPSQKARRRNELETIEEEMIDSEQQQYRDGGPQSTLPRDRSVLTPSIGTNSTESLVQKMAARKYRETVIVYTVGILLFLGMVALFALGGVYWSRNGW